MYYIQIIIMLSKCNNDSNKLCGNICCIFCFNKSFMSHEKSSFIITTQNILLIPLNSSLKYDFMCNKCLHIFSQSLNEITNRNAWCPYCSKPPKKLCDIDACKNCFEKSFASHEKSKFLIDDVNPRFIFTPVKI